MSIDTEEFGRTIPTRTGDPETSHAAEKKIEVRAGKQRHRLLKPFATGEAYVHGGLTDNEAAEIAGALEDHSCWWKRCSELREGGYIEPTGETRLGEADVQRMVCRITDTGRRALALANKKLEEVR